MEDLPEVHPGQLFDLNYSPFDDISERVTRVTIKSNRLWLVEMVDHLDLKTVKVLRG